MKPGKKGVSMFWATLIGIILLLFSGGILLAAVKNQASKLDEDLQVKLCRTSNEIKFGLQDKTSGVVSGPQVCYTIDKTDKNRQVPKAKYPQNNIGAESEIRDMVKNCWNMWLEGSQKNTFEKYPFSEGCFTCYTFKIKNDVGGVTFKSLSDSLSEPYFAKDTSSQCSPYGGTWKASCSRAETEFNSKKTPPGANYKCCVNDVRNECENKGGRCSASGSPSGFPRIYNEWQCPGSSESCYVREDAVFSFARYIREFGQRGGDIFFMPPGGTEAANIDFVPGERYAVSFISPSSQLCTKEGGVGCYASIGGYAIGTVAGGALLYFVGAPIAAVGGGTIKLLGISGVTTVAGTAYAANEFGVIDRLLVSGAEFVTSGITIEVPNFIVVSTEQDARKLGCTVQYGGEQ